MPSSPRQAMTFAVSLVVASLFAALLMPLASHSRDNDSSDEGEGERDDPLGTMFWTLWKGSELNGAQLFAARLRHNWRTVETTARRQWWRRAKKRQTCEEDASDPQIQAARGLLQRNFPALQSKIRFSRDVECVDARSGGCFTVAVEEDVLCVRGSSGVELASGLYWFVKEECEGMSTWKKTGGTQLMESCLGPDRLDALRASLSMKRSRSVPLSFYQNVVTSSYSMAFWDWRRWEAEIDWMALHGVNLPLALTGQEFIWVKVYQELGIEFAELADFFTGPAFLAWGRMGNIQGHAGPLPWSYIQGQAELQKKIVRRMREFGMTPVFSGFAGFIPRALIRRYPDLKAKKSFNWCQFPDEYCCVWLLDPEDPLFHKIGSSFVRYQRSEYGADREGFYSVDVFNEMVPSQSDPGYLRQTSQAVYSALKAADPSAVWIMQAWLFYSDIEFWGPDQIKAVLSGVPTGRLLLLDLYAERYPQWKRTEGFFGRPFIWCNLHNFGGNSEMHGAMPEIACGIEDALRAQTNIVGMGMCPEGLEQNPVVYELMSEMAFRDHTPDLEEWLHSYAIRRYGGRPCLEAHRAWKILGHSVYRNTDQRPETAMDIPNSRPGLKPQEVVWGLRPHVWYNPNEVVDAWDALLLCKASLGSLSSYRYDLIDVGRQVMSKLATKYWKRMEEAYNSGDSKALLEHGEVLLELLQDMDDLVSTHEGFLFAPVLESARLWGETEGEKTLMERNVKLQVTLWGQSPTGDTELSDYANKHWSGLVESFYKERWRLWLHRCLEDLKSNRPYDAAEFVKEIVEFTHQWIESENLRNFVTEPRGDAIALSERLFLKYKSEAWLVEMDI